MTPTIRLILKVLCFMPILLGVALINYTQDPANVFGSYESRVAQALLSGMNVTDCKLSTEAERLVEKYYIKRSSNVPDVIVLGSSRSNGIHSDVWRGQSFFNHSVSAASLNDYIAIYGYYKKKQSLPKTVVINVDPWLFNRYNNNAANWKVLADSYYWMTSEQDRFDIKFRFSEYIPDRMAELFSFSYVQQTLRNAQWQNFFKPRTSANFTVTSERYNTNSTILSDGSREVSAESKEFQTIKALDNAKEYISNGEVERFHQKFTQADPELRQRFEWFVSMIKKDGVQVIFLLPPYHPFVYQSFSDNHFQTCDRIEDYLRQYVAANGYQIFGSYNPSRLALTGKNFYDALHIDEEGFKRIFDYKK